MQLPSHVSTEEGPCPSTVPRPAAFFPTSNVSTCSSSSFSPSFFMVSLLLRKSATGWRNQRARGTLRKPYRLEEARDGAWMIAGGREELRRTSGRAGRGRTGG